MSSLWTGAADPPEFSPFGRRRLRGVLFIAAGLVLAWQIVTVGLAPAFAPIFPWLTLALAPREPSALRVLAEDIVEPRDPDATRLEDLSAADKAKARRLAREAVAQAPLRPQAFRLLGRLASREHATRFMEAAAQRSLTDSGALQFLLTDRIEQKQFAHAAEIAELLMQSRRDLQDRVGPALARIAETEEGGPVVRRMIARNPQWRDSFLMALPASVTDARTPLRLLLAARNAPSPRSEASMRAYLDALLRAGHYEFAYEAWRKLLPKDRAATPGGLYNPRFARPLTASPFDWTIAGASGVSIDIVRVGDERALSVRYGQSRAKPHSVSQYVKLAPGSYRLSGRMRGAIAGPRGLRWRVACVNVAKPLGESEMARGRYPDWTPFQFEFVAPETECPLQSVWLELDARSPSEWLVSGEMLYAGLKLERLEENKSATQ